MSRRSYPVSEHDPDLQALDTDSDSQNYAVPKTKILIHNSPWFDSSILRHSWIWGAANEAVLNNVHCWKNERTPVVTIKHLYSTRVRISYTLRFLGVANLTIFNRDANLIVSINSL